MADYERSAGVAVACGQCGLISHVPPLEPHHKANCPRCGHTLSALKSGWVDKVCALSVASLLLLVLSISFTFLTFHVNGMEQSISLLSVIETLTEQGYLGLSAIVLFVCIGLPASVMCMLLVWMMSIKMGFGLSAAKAQIQLCFNVIKWCMPEVFVIGVLVSMVKILTMADLEFGPSFYFYVAFILSFACALMYLDRHQVELVLLKQPIVEGGRVSKQQRVQWTWALLLTAVLLYLPANFLPIMTTRFLGADTPSTIVSGVMTMWQNDSRLIAVIIFVASILVPVFKILAIGYLNYTVQHNSLHNIKRRQLLYRITEFIGRWSMIDVFVVAILAGLVQMGSAMSVYPGPAVVAFCSVVILTMLAAMSFDSRMIWESDS